MAPERELSPEEVVQLPPRVSHSAASGTRWSWLPKAHGPMATCCTSTCREKLRPISIRELTVLGHTQRGGATGCVRPTAGDAIGRPSCRNAGAG